MSRAALGMEMIIDGFKTGCTQTLRLQELGFLHGRSLRILQSADAVICQLDNARVGLARRLADLVYVRSQSLARAVDAHCSAGGK